MSVTRFSISLEEELAKELDQYVIDNRFSNRSQAVRHLVEKNIVEKKWRCDNIVAGAIVLTYDYLKKDISSSITEIRHAYLEEILSSQLFQLEDDICLEIIAVKGIAKRLTELSDKLIAIKGIRHGKLIMSRTR
jgi:CopG family nickel-responsive transcriptional regulator